VRWYRRAADAGNADAEFKLAELHLAGRGVPQDGAQAASWLERAARRGNRPSMFKLAYVCNKGASGLPADMPKAINWYEQAVAWGDGAAANNLGVIYAKGDGVTQDLVLAYGWFLTAERMQVESATAALVAVGSKLTKKEIKQAKKQEEKRLRKQGQKRLQLVKR
jgi:TPR repeat protein